MTEGHCFFSWGSGGTVSSPTGPGQSPGGSPGEAKPPESFQDFVFCSTQKSPKTQLSRFIFVAAIPVKSQKNIFRNPS